MRLSEIERISASDFTGADTLSRGLIGLTDEMFDYWEELPEFRKWINNLMAIGAEHQGEDAGYQWFAVPLRAMRRELNILKGFQLYNRSDGDTPDLITTLMARRRGAQ